MTLAKYIYNEHPDKFKDIEQVRSRVRYYRGASGEKNSRTLTIKEFVGQCTIPEPYEVDYEPFTLCKEADNILKMADIHIPFHDPVAIAEVIRWGKDHGVNTILLNGDIIDCYQLSQFIRDARYPTIREELERAAEFLDYLKGEFPDTRIYWKNGNHEDRLETYLMIKAPELLNVLDYRLSTLLNFWDRGIIPVTDKRKVIAGKLTILHGHEFGGGGSTNIVNPARSLFNRTYQSAMVDHSHRTSEHTDSNLDGEVITCWSSGCLCQLHPRFARLNKWNHGFSRIRIYEDGTYKVANIRIINGKIY